MHGLLKKIMRRYQNSNDSQLEMEKTIKISMEPLTAGIIVKSDWQVNIALRSNLSTSHINKKTPIERANAVQIMTILNGKSGQEKQQQYLHLWNNLLLNAVQISSPLWLTQKPGETAGINSVLKTGINRDIITGYRHCSAHREQYLQSQQTITSIPLSPCHSSPDNFLNILNNISHTKIRVPTHFFQWFSKTFPGLFQNI